MGFSPPYWKKTTQSPSHQFHEIFLIAAVDPEIFNKFKIFQAKTEEAKDEGQVQIDPSVAFDSLSPMDCGEGRTAPCERKLWEAVLSTADIVNTSFQRFVLLCVELFRLDNASQVA